jgi:hypothetical protein
MLYALRPAFSACTQILATYSSKPSLILFLVASIGQCLYQCVMLFALCLLKHNPQLAPH